MKKVFSNDKTHIRTGLRRTKSLKDLLVPSVLPDLNRTDTSNSDVVGCFRCDHKVCDACHNFLLPSNRIKSVATGKSYKIRHSLSCHTDYIIYCAICLLCNRQCVGSSVNFRARLSNHKSHIRQKKRTCHLVNHFIDNAHDHPSSSLKFVLIEQVSTKTEEFLEQREGYLWLSKWCKIQHFEILFIFDIYFIYIHHLFIYIHHLFIHIQHLFIHIQHLFIHIQHLFIRIQHLFTHIQHLFIHIQHLFIYIQHLFIHIQHLCVFSISIYSSSTLMLIKLHLHSTIIFIQNVTFIFYS